MSKIKTVFVVGPTASGKTALSIELAKVFGGEIVSADSMQIYKGIHIASAAPDAEEMSGIPHHLIEFLETDQEFSVADYVFYARDCIKDIHLKGKLPIVVGGTGLYVSSLLDNTEYAQEKTDFELREQLEKRFDQAGAENMLKELAVFDAETANRLHPNDRRRIIRAFEVYKLTGKTITQLYAQSHLNPSFIEPLVLGITYSDREKLYERINKRVDIMFQKGLLQEAAQNLEEANNKGVFQAIGHKELYGYLKGENTLEEASELLKRQTRRYAKRQMTWFKRDERINWLYADCEDDIYKTAQELTEKFLKE